MLEPDWTERGALLAALADEGGERIVAIGNYVRLRDPALAESAFAVADSEQGRGIGTRLLERLAARAAGVGIERFVAEVLPENRSMLGVFERAGFELKRELADGVVEVQFPIASTERFELSVEERDHAARRRLAALVLRAESVAVVGASPRRGTIGGELFRNVLQGDFAGAAYPVNPKGAAVAGVRGYASVAEIPDPVDLAVIAVPGEHVLDAAEDALRNGVRALVVISAGFAEVGSEGAERQEQLLALVRAHGARLIGPNCLGIAVAGPRLNATFAARSAPSGNIGFSSQSGALGLALLEAADARGLGLSAFVSIGNKADVSSNDLLEWWEEDESTEVVLLYVESFGNPRRFGRLARRVARSKPILALKSGTSATGQRAASSHTAALAGSEAGVDALFHQAGVTRAASLEELIDVATLLSSQPEPKGRRVAVLTNAGGLGILAADACDAAGLELPTLGEETVTPPARAAPCGGKRRESGRHARIGDRGELRAGATDRAGRPPRRRRARALRARGQRHGRAGRGRRRRGGPRGRLRQARARGRDELGRRPGGASLRFGRRRVRLPGVGGARARPRRRSAQSGSGDRSARFPRSTRIDRAAAASVVERALAAAEDSWLDPAETRELLAAYGLPLVPERVAERRRRGRSGRAELGFPAVVKSAAPGAHKTETGGIALDLEDEAAVRAAAERIGFPVVVQPMLRGGTELLAGLLQDPVFGPLVAFGPGGVFAELIGEASLRIAPLTDIDAEELVTAGKAGRLVRGFRGADPADPAALVDLVHRLAALGEDLPAVAELDLNPVLGFPDRAVAVDARVRIRRPQEQRREKSW